MKRNLLSTLALSGICISAQAAIPITSYESTAVEIPSEYAVQGGYTGVAVGLNFSGTNNMGVELIPDTTNPDDVIQFPDLSIKSKPGIVLMLTSGYRIYRWRFEAELAYRFNKSETISTFTYAVSPPPPGPITPHSLNEDLAANGGTSAISLMGNILYDRYYISGWMWTLGFGAGGVYLNYNTSADTESLAGAPFPVDPASSFTFTKKTFVPAVQAIIGFGYTWSDHLETALTYRYMFLFNDKYWADGTFIHNRTIQFNPQYRVNMLNLEFRFT